MEHLSNDHEDHPNRNENNRKVCNEMRHSISSLLESQWKKRQHGQNFPMEAKPFQNTSIRRKKEI